MALQQNRRIDRIEVVYPGPTLQVRYIDEIIDTDTQEVIATKGYFRESYDFTADLSMAPSEVQAAAAAMLAFQQAQQNV